MAQPVALHLPRPELIRLHRFTIFEKATTVEVAFPAGVFCLAGANGLGKSTFLAALNFAITGVVAEPGREFRGVEDYYRKVRAYSESFFRGRIDAEDAAAAEVELTMRVGDYRYRVRRGMFDSLELRELQVTSALDNRAVRLPRSDADPKRLHEIYSQRLVRDCRLESFAQLVFLQHFVLTFDERRELLFWGGRTLPAALFIAFGLDPAKARRADSLQRTVRAADSLARNYSWQASDWRRQLDNLERLAGDVNADDEGIAREHRDLVDQQGEVATEVQSLAEELASTQLRIASRSAQLRADRSQYDALWARRLQGHGHPSAHPLVTVAIQESRCSLCGSSGPTVVSHIEGRIGAGYCPLCDAHLVATRDADDVDVDALAALDDKIVQHQDVIAAAEDTVDELQRRLNRAREQYDALSVKVSAFERDNELALLRGTGDVDIVAERYRGAIAEQLQRKEKELQRRNQAQTEWRALQRELVGAYSVAEDRFVPSFTRLAQSFIGLELDIELIAGRNDVGLQLMVHGSRRRNDQALSESQRFFLDIALRMALVVQMTASGSAGLLYVDTPEGSLDIAYEARAGDMFGTFVRDGYGLIMTANINTSKLLERLARRCGRRRMRLERMTDWSPLSEVQAAEEQLFDDAFGAIEAALDEAGR